MHSFNTHLLSPSYVPRTELSFKDVTLDDALSRGLRSVEEQQETKKYIICKLKISGVKKGKAKEGGRE